MIEVINIVADCPGSEKTHGYTEASNGWDYFWIWDGEEVSFREHGYPQDHPIYPTPNIKRKTREWVMENEPFY